MTETFSENGISLTYEITEDGRLLLLQCGREGERLIMATEAKDCFYPFSVHLTGETTTLIRGGRHFGVCGAENWKYVSLQKQPCPEGTQLIFELAHGSVSLFLHYQFYTGLSVLRAWTELVNRGNKMVGVEYLSSFCLMGLGSPEERADVRVWLPHNAWRREVDWKEYTLPELGFEKISPISTKRIHLSNTGSWSTKEYLPMGAWCNARTRKTLLWQIESNGSWQWEISDEKGPFYLLLSGPDESENHWYRELKPGEAFESVRAAVAFGQDFSGALAELTRYRRRIVSPFEADRNLPVIFNDYMNCLWAKPTTEKELPLIRCAAELGAEYFCMDAGWYSDENNWWDTIGEWSPSQKRFPNGIQEVFHEIRKCGMVPGIWLEIENMGIHCPIVDQFDDACFVTRHGKRVVDKGRYQLDYRNQQVRQFATDVVDRLVRELGIGYIKIDYNIDIGCGTEHNSDSFGDGLLQMNRAYLSWVTEIHKKYPHLILENCSSGGMRMDYAMLSHHALQSVTDQESCLCMAPIAAAAATAVLPEQAAIWVYPKATDSPELTGINLVNALPLRIHLSGEVMSWSEEQTALVKEGIACYKTIRRNVSRSVPFYPLGVPQYGMNWLCAGYRSAKETYLAVWRLGDEATIQIPLQNPPTSAEILYPSHKGNVECLLNGVEIAINDCPGAVFVKLT